LNVSADEYFKAPTRYTHRALKLGQEAAEEGAVFVAAAPSLSDEQIDSKVQERAAAKKSKDFKRADEIRQELVTAGVLLEDKPGGVTQWRRG
jgi:cysteinyl-tRNA synthetase